MMKYVKYIGIPHSIYSPIQCFPQLKSNIHHFSLDLSSGNKTLRTKLKLFMYHPISFPSFSNTILRYNQYPEFDICHSHVYFFFFSIHLNTYPSSVVFYLLTLFLCWCVRFCFNLLIYINGLLDSYTNPPLLIDI